MYHQVNLSELATERLYFRHLTLEDGPLMAEFFGSEEAIRFYPDIEVNDPREPERWITRQMGRYKDWGAGLFGLFRKEDDAYIGQCGILFQEVDGKTEVEVGYNLLPRYWGNGYATEAAVSCKEYIFRHNISPSVVSIIDIGNVNSQRVAMRNGMVRDKQAEFKGLQVYVYRIQKPA
jgi:RimJ/RimL family protein N-acetyltransferase